MRRRSDLTQSRLHELLSYDPLTGQFTWKNSRGSAKAGRVAGTPNGQGYLVIMVDGVSYLAHRLASLSMAGAFPDAFTDHANGDRADNSWVNLRPATQAENMQNACLSSRNKSGIMGVCWLKRERLWRASISIKSRRKYLGDFATREQGQAAYLAAKAEAHSFQPIPRKTPSKGRF